VYAETVPYITKRLGGDLQKIRKSIFVGSTIPLCMCLLWTAVSIMTVPFHSMAATYDPVNRLLAITVGSTGYAVLKYSILVLAFSAISTTVIGSLLTLTQFLEDIFSVNRIEPQHHRDSTRLLLKALAIVPCALVAASGSDTLYYAATAFAGAFPVTLLWGLFPALAYIRLQDYKNSGTSSVAESIPSKQLKGPTLSMRTISNIMVLLSYFMLCTNMFLLIPTKLSRQL
jgi:tyrosine-specific transport protein